MMWPRQRPYGPAGRANLPDRWGFARL